jgi:hypothetical protein
MDRLPPQTVQELWDLRAKGTSVRRTAILLGISRNTVRAYIRRGVHDSAFPPAPTTAQLWRARLSELLLASDGKSTGVSLAQILRAEGFELSTRSVQREVRAWHQAALQRAELDRLLQARSV